MEYSEPTPAHLAKWSKQLESDKFKERKNAFDELSRAFSQSPSKGNREVAVPWLRKEMEEKNIDVDKKRWLEVLLIEVTERLDRGVEGNPSALISRRAQEVQAYLSSN